MKKILFLLFVFSFASYGYSQTKYAVIKGPGKDLKLEQTFTHPAFADVKSGDQVIGQKSYNDLVIGTTWYDAQALNYGNTMRRAYAYPDGTIGAIWLAAGEESPPRGAGYNYFNGSDWVGLDMHVGPDEDNMGTANYAPWGPNGEIIAQYRYIAGEGPMRFYKRENKGEGEWIETILNGPEGTSLVWHTMTTSGENHEFIHLLALTYDAPYQGQGNALLYYRSSDGAETWEIDGMVIEGLGSDYFPSIGSLSYDWANPVGETIAFTYGFDSYGGRVFKSDDNGDSWEVINVYETPVDPFDPPTDFGPLPCGIGTSACALDSEGKVHVVFPRTKVSWTDGNFGWFPYTDGLIYWNETMEVLDTTIISSYTLDYLAEAGNLIGWVLSSDTFSIASGQPNYANPLCAFPQISIDANDNLFVAWCAIAPDAPMLDEFYYKHICKNESFDGGNTWELPVDLTDDMSFIFMECAFPMLPPVIDGSFHVIYQKDTGKGMHTWLNNHDAMENEICYMTDIFVSNPAKPEEFSFDLSTPYPNPADQKIQINLKLGKVSVVSASITNLLGQEVLDHKQNKLNAGMNNLQLDVEHLVPGIYLCNIMIDDQRVTHKIVIE